MPKYSVLSRERLSTCDEALQHIFNEVILYYDCSILCGHRSKEDQDEAFENKRSKVRWPDSKHNDFPSLAVDAVPYPIIWPEAQKMLKRFREGRGTIDQIMMTIKDLSRFYHFAGFVLGVAQGMGVSLRWGGDWDGDRDFKDQDFDDLPHFELVNRKDIGVVVQTPSSSLFSG